MTGGYRIRTGGEDSGARIGFTFNGRRMAGRAGDTLASALLANGQRLVGRSFKYHRPRGIFSAGPEEPNALVQLHRGARLEPNTRATVTELFEGLEARSQNHFGSLEHDLLAVNDVLSPFLTAGFYYKTFMWPKSFWEKLYEPMIRSSAGLGRLSGEADPDEYDKGFLHCDLLIVGAGPAGIGAALAAAPSGVRIILADEDFALGGRLNSETYELDGQPCRLWAVDALSELASFDNVRLMPRTTIYGAFDHGIYGALERRTDHIAPGTSTAPRQVLWRIYSRRSILASGAVERPIAFGNNDRPGIMLAGAVRAYANRFDVSCGRRVAVFTNNDDGWRTATDLLAKGVEVVAVIDTRAGDPPAKLTGLSVFSGQEVINASGRKALRSITLANGQSIDADCLAVSGGWNPAIHLASHLGGRPVWNDEVAGFVPGGLLPAGMSVAGAANGSLTLEGALQDGLSCAKSVLEHLGKPAPAWSAPTALEEPAAISACWLVPRCRHRAWIDFQNDVTQKDLDLSSREGFGSVEHLKRYTTLGMGTDQGKTSNVVGLAVMAELSGKSIPEVGTTVFRPPYTPVPIAAFAGRSRAGNFRPVRLTPSHAWAVERGAVFVEAGNWLRAQWFPRAGETHWRESVDREVRMTRGTAGYCDVTTLGKIDIKGRDVGIFLDRVYTGTFSTLPVGKVRYGLMLREDGIAYDDGTTARLGETHYVMTTTTANAGLVFRNLEFARQCLWPELDVHLVSITDGWAQFSVAGPNSRELLGRLIDPEHDVSNDAFPYMACGEISVCGGLPARLFRISFSGELAYEIAVPARYGDAMIRRLSEAATEFDAGPYGTEALGVMRIEKGHASGNELNGQTTALNLGLTGVVSTKKDFIGKVLAERPEMNRDDAVRFMGFVPVDASSALSAGAHFLPLDSEATTENDEGWMSSVAYSPMLGHYIGLGFIRRGHERVGDIVRAWDGLRGADVQVRITSPHFHDPKGERLRG